eukprot:1143267-Pelagomonas_calceolata.AAC.1
MHTFYMCSNNSSQLSNYLQACLVPNSSSHTQTVHSQPLFSVIRCSTSQPLCLAHITCMPIYAQHTSYQKVQSSPYHQPHASNQPQAFRGQGRAKPSNNLNSRLQPCVSAVCTPTSFGPHLLNLKTVSLHRLDSPFPSVCRLNSPFPSVYVDSIALSILQAPPAKLLNPNFYRPLPAYL